LFHLSSPIKGILNESKRHLATAVAENIALALANLQLREELHAQSIRDPLTGLFNRRYLEESLKQLLHFARRKKQPLGMIMLDVDYFKRFNDTYGHDAGDLVLQKIAAYLQNNIRGSDIACRYGGEEMIIILPEASLENTRQRAEQLRAGIKGLKIRHNNQSLDKITVSLGVSAYPENGNSSQELFEAADSALYQAKAQGRDRVITAQ
jgi:diguanylate cyclase (GGDEF)-like protein